MGHARDEAQVLQHMASVFSTLKNIGPASASNWTTEKVKALQAITDAVSIKRVLDLGIGDLCVMKAWPDFGKVDYVGVDGCAPIIEQAESELPGCLFFWMPFSQLLHSSLTASNYHLVLALDILYHIQEDWLHAAMLDYIFQARRAVALTYATEVQDFGGKKPGQGGFAWFPRPLVGQRIEQEQAKGWELVYESTDFRAGPQKQRLVALVRR